ncbi:MAG: hypothetical protein ACJAZ2_001368 [Glaciecola sp.]|jgi:hypothetical protein
MSIYSFHLTKTSTWFTVKALVKGILPEKVNGLKHAECMVGMTLGSPIISLSRFKTRNLAVFAQWENEAVLESFLSRDKVGKVLNEGYHIRLNLIRKWGGINEFPDSPTVPVDQLDMKAPVVAITLARLKLQHLTRFIKWGRPVEKQVRDHSATTLALAAFRFPTTFSTFSIWQSQKAMVQMVYGKDEGDNHDKHKKAMDERERKDFHKQFTTMRFKCISEHGKWEGNSNFIPK